MRLLLFLVSALFSVIFYSFYLLSNGQNIFREGVVGDITFNAISGNFLIETIVFLVLGTLLVIIFTPLNESKSTLNKMVLVVSFFYILILVPLYFSIFYTDYKIIILIILFLSGDILFQFVSHISYLSTKKIKLRYSGLIISYLVSVFSLLYLVLISNSYYLIIILVYYIFFNYDVYKKYKNYVSLAIMLGIVIVLLTYYTLDIIDRISNFLSI